MPEEALIEEQLSSVSLTSPNSPSSSQKTLLTSLQDLEPPRRPAAPSTSSPPSTQTSPPPPPTTLTEIENIAYHATPSASVPPLPAHRSHDRSNNLKRSDPFQFGSRYLEAGDDVFEWNAWDHVDPSRDELFVAYAQRQFEFQREHRLSEFDRHRFNQEPEKWWDKFYGNNQERFFKDRKWLQQEFPVLSRCCAGLDGEENGEGKVGGKEGAVGGGGEVAGEDENVGAEKDANGECQDTVDDATTQATNDATTPSGPARSGGDWLPPPSTPSTPFNTILEIGAGAGNTAFPVLAQNRNPHLLIHATDFSKRAVELIKSNPAYNTTHIRASVWDMASITHSLPDGVAPGSVDVVMLVFAFSALSPRQWAQAVRNVYTALRPGGEVCFRDYGRGDLAQVRFKKGRLLEENFYIRGDGTRVYFFELEELRAIWGGRLAEVLPAFEVGGSGNDVEESNGQTTEGGSIGTTSTINDKEETNKVTTAKQIVKDAESAPAFDILALAADRRLLVNRSSKLKMYRCWMQGRFRKPFDSPSEAVSPSSS